VGGGDTVISMTIAKRLTLMQAALLCAASLFLLVALLLSTPAHLASSSRTMLAQVVGLSAGVIPNSDNMLAAQFAAKEKELAEREAELSSRMQSTSSESLATTIASISLGMSLFLFVLLVTHLIYDRRRILQAPPALAVDLRRKG